MATETFDFPVGSVDDDASAVDLLGTPTYSTGPSVLAGTGGNAPTRCVIRIPNVTGLAANRIASAHLFIGAASTQNDINADISFEATPDGTDFATRNTAAAITAITTTAAAVTWTETGLAISTTNDSPDLAAPLIETLSNGYASGDALVVVLDGLVTPAHRLTINSSYGAGTPTYLRVVMDPYRGWVRGHAWG